MKKYSFIKYIIVLLCLILFAVLSTQLSIYTYEKTLSSYNAFPRVIVSYFLYMIFGLILGIESLVFRKKHVKFNFDVTKFVLLSIPFFILGSVHLVSLSGLLQLKLNSLFFNEQFLSFCQMIFGYNLITSFICDNEEIKEKE